MVLDLNESAIESIIILVIYCTTIIIAVICFSFSVWQRFFSVTDGTEVNMLHGSDTAEKAQEELGFFFPVQQTVAVIKPDAYDNKSNVSQCPVFVMTVHGQYPRI